MKKRYIIPIVISVLMLAVNIVSRFSRQFSDFYVQKIFPHISGIVSHISGLFPFSVGEVMIIAGILLVVIGLPLFLIMLLVRKDKRRRTAGIFTCTFLWVFTFIWTTETLNCFVMYHCTPFSERYFGKGSERSDEQLTQLYAMLVDEADRLAEQVPRDENDRFILTCDYNKEAKETMKRTGMKYPQLKGYYPTAKKIRFSYFMSQSNLLGIYFPFSLESNYNKDMVSTNYPSTICHEYAHLKGIIQEDEANFISFIANVESENIEFRYSGYLNALEYVHNEIYEQNITSAYGITDKISDKVTNDWFRFMPDDYWEKNKDKEIIPTETVSTVSDAAIDTNIRLNGRDDGIKAYSHVVNLLLDYYFSDNKYTKNRGALP